jgi:tRNA-specific adenosine deaminase 3
MLVRIKTFEEEREMSFVTAFAEKILLDECSIRIKSKDNEPIPPFLKRIKKDLDGRVLMLKGIGENENFVKVKIPAFEPLTVQQFLDAKREWPCFFYNHPEIVLDETNEKLSEKLNEKMTQKLTEKLTEKDFYCSGACLIYCGNQLVHESFDQEPIIGHSVSDCVSAVSRQEVGYLCTGFTAYLYKEPCVSCAMALVHGRINKIIYLHENVEHPFSKLKLNHCKDLNHRFEVFYYKP